MFLFLSALSVAGLFAQPQTPTTRLEEMGAVKMVAVVSKEVSTPAPKKVMRDPAELQAMYNKARADCLREAVDNKIEGDIMLGRIRDFGNILAPEVEICGKHGNTFDQDGNEVTPKK